MSRVYLVRHGQAGLRHHYDTLSELGCVQAEHLRRWFTAERVHLDQVVSGTLTRQLETARLAAREPVSDARLAEFDLDAVYRALAPLLCERDPEFRREYEEMLRSMASHDAPVHRQWNRCDVAVFQAWHSNALPYDGESWGDFKARILHAWQLIRTIPNGSHVAIFTSATPIGLLLADLMGAGDEQAMKLAGACYNSSVTTLRVHDGDVRLIGFNSVAHLPDPALRTFR